MRDSCQHTDPALDVSSGADRCYPLHINDVSLAVPSLAMTPNPGSDFVLEVEPKGNQKENAQNMKSDIKGLLDTDLFDMDDIDWTELEMGLD